MRPHPHLHGTSTLDTVSWIKSMSERSSYPVLKNAVILQIMQVRFFSPGRDAGLHGSICRTPPKNDRCKLRQLTKRRLQEVDIPLTEAELLEPHRCKERIREVFVKLVSANTGVV